MKEKLNYILQLADNALILGHRLSEWCGHGPVLEQDMAMTNIALDLVGQARNLYQYAAELEGKGRTEDDLAYLRDVFEFRNVLLVELPNKDFAYTVIRQFLFDSFNFYQYQQLSQSKDERLAAIATKSLKEVTYHLRWSSEWTIRLGDGTDVSHQKIQTALNDYWAYVGELTQATLLEQQMDNAGIGANVETIKTKQLQKIDEIFTQATLQIPENSWMQSGGKEGNHTEHLGYILADMQYLQRAYPGAEW